MNIPPLFIGNVRLRVTMKNDQEPYVAKCLGKTASCTITREIAAQRAAQKAFNDILRCWNGSQLESDEQIQLHYIAPEFTADGPAYVWDATIKEAS